LVSGQGDTSITVSFSSSFVSGLISVRSSSYCGVSATKSLTVTKVLPATPTVLNGSADIYVCTPSGTNPAYSYSTRSIANASSYSWTVPAGATIISGQGDTVITVSFDSAFISGSISVRAVRPCGMSAAKSITVTKRVPGAPTVLIGNADICSAFAGDTTVAYYTNTVPYASGYLWTVPTGATIVSGQGDTSVRIQFASTFVSGTISVRSISSCGRSATVKSLSISKRVPTAPTVLTGTTEVCAAITGQNIVYYNTRTVLYATSYLWTVPRGATIVSGQGDTIVGVRFDTSFASGNITVSAVSPCGTSTAKTLAITKLIIASPASIAGPASSCPYYGNNTTATYTAAAVTGATGYFWTVPTNVRIVSGQGTIAINVVFDSGYVTSALRVRALNGCSYSTDRSLTVTATPFAVPGLISGPTNACTYVNQGNIATYTIRKVTGATGYFWTVPAGVTIVSRPGGYGVNDTVINVTFNSNFIYGTSIQVSSLGCTMSAARSLLISGTLPTIPGAITGTANVCANMVSSTKPNGDSVTYKIRKVASASGYIWTVPTNATIVSRPGANTENDTLIRVVFGSAFTGGTITVKSSNYCGSSAPTSYNVSRTVASTPGAITATLVSKCPTPVYTYKIAALPASATSVTWTVPAGGTIVSGQGTVSIRVSYSPTSTISGAVTVRAVNNCSISAATSLTVSYAACSSPAVTNVPSATTRVEQVVKVEEMSVNVYPNPTTSQFNISVKSTGSEKIQLIILDVQGREVKRAMATAGEVKQIGSDLKPGTYIMQATQGGVTKTTRLLKF